jgi:hypothetical protein
MTDCLSFARQAEKKEREDCNLLIDRGVKFIVLGEHLRIDISLFFGFLSGPFARLFIYSLNQSSYVSMSYSTSIVNAIQ